MCEYHDSHELAGQPGTRSWKTGLEVALKAVVSNLCGRVRVASFPSYTCAGVAAGLGGAWQAGGQLKRADRDQK